jgi:methionyl aminopeptidase
MTAASRHSFIENGQKITQILKELVNFATTHHQLEDIESLANELISQAGGEPAFKRVPGYHHATCISVNSTIVHGIPKGTIKKGDLVTIDSGMVYQGTTTDTATTFKLGDPTLFSDPFLALGIKTLKKTVNHVKAGIKVKDLSHIMQSNIESKGYNVTRNLTGHGLGATMHEEPPIPCFISKDPGLSYRLKEGQVLAIEVMYMKGDWPLTLSPDGWSLSTADNSESAVFEVDVLVEKSGAKILAGFPLEPEARV